MVESHVTSGRSRWFSIIILILVFGVSIVAIGYISNETKNALVESTKSELSSLAALSASQINGSMLANLTEGDENTPEFISIRDQLWAMEQSHPDIKYVYTMRRVHDTIQFVVDAEYGMDTPGENPSIGEIYPAPSPEMIKGFNENTAEHEFITDEWGTTLSGYAPIRDSFGQVVGIVGVDMSADRVIERINFFDEIFLLLIFAIFFVIIVGGIGFEVFRSRSDRAIAKSAERYHAVVDAQTEFVIRFRPDGTLLFANEAYCRYLEKPCSELVGRRMVPPLPPDDQEQLAHHLASLTPSHPVASIEHQTLIPGGEKRWLQWTDRAFFDDGGRPVEYQSVGRDITERKRAEEALKQATKKLNLLNSIIFTDIRNALFTLSGYFYLQKGLSADETVIRYQNAQEVMIRKIEESLDSAKDYQNLGLFPSVWQNVVHTFLIAISHLDLSHLSRKISISEFEIYADPLLEKVFFQLAQNVIEHAETATEISLYGYEIASGLTLVFSDNGIGIPHDEKEQIFQQGYNKTGFGLFLTREILSITGITITETGEPGTGARFEIHVPTGSYRMIPDADAMHETKT